MDKISSAQAAQMVKLAADEIRSLNTEVVELRTKVAHYVKRERAERIASMMEDKGLNEGLDFQEKVASLLQRDDLGVVEEAVGMSAPQMKLASIAGLGVEVEDFEGAAEAQFAVALASMD